MKKTLTLAALLAALALPLAAIAKNPNKNNNKEKEEPAARFDTNHNGKIDKGAESEALRNAFNADKTGPLSKYDTNHNGNLEDDEIAAINVPIKHGKGK